MSDHVLFLKSFLLLPLLLKNLISYFLSTFAFLGALELIMDKSRAGSCLWITNRRGMEYWPTPIEEAKYLLRSSASSRKKISLQAPLSTQLPPSFEKV